VTIPSQKTGSLSLSDMIASLKNDFSQLNTLIKSLGTPGVCSGGNVTIRAHYLPFRNGKPMTGELLDVTVKNGVAFHYGNIPAILRTAVEQAFVSGDLQYLVCTSTLLAGVNLPARNLFLCQPLRKKGSLESVDFWNLAGRAGRLRREFQGNIYLIN
jgi:superfamily II helicase